jgi:hypothetical protein
VAPLNNAGNRLQCAQHLVLGGFQHNHVNLFQLVLTALTLVRQQRAF